MKSLASYFYGSFAISFVALVIGYLLGGWGGVFVVVLLSVLEVSLSIDNAVVNAKILDSWNKRWRRLFIMFGLPVAVFGMRLVFPILIVSVTTGLGSLEVINMAVYDPQRYSETILSVHHQVAAFGGAFLLMVAIKFFIDRNKNEHWLKVVESPLTRLGQMEAIEAAAVLIVVIAIASSFLSGHEQLEFVMAGIWGIISYILVRGLSSLLSGESKTADLVVRQGLAGFLYLEILDASFSFDGVIGAFALSNNLFIIVLGLGVGAMFVRSLTIYLVDKKTLTKYKYLEHGAFWAFGMLAMMMFLGVHYHIPEVVTGFLGAAFIGAAFWESVMENKKKLIG